MSMPMFSFSADAASGAPAGQYVCAETVQQLEQTLDKLVWHVLYGKAIDASTAAVTAEQVLGRLRSGA